MKGHFLRKKYQGNRLYVTFRLIQREKDTLTMTDRVIEDTRKAIDKTSR